MDPEVADMDLSDPELEKAATKIQATFKGYKARREKDDAAGREEQEGTSTEPAKTEAAAAGAAAAAADDSGETIDIDLNDPDVEKAATKIQATFKGYKQRREARENADS